MKTRRRKRTLEKLFPMAQKAILLLNRTRNENFQKRNLPPEKPLGGPMPLGGNGGPPGPGGNGGRAGRTERLAEE